ncbi:MULTISPECIES: diiron oxygenase [unclassified Pseudonocardia]|uniref:diiron oxygenase n=1 Tax=unclassified Pseudonocardia TaxID=2619320 RepID=UPI0011151A4F|nr:MULTISPECIES: diiron oxygenase [unclassified Pseudonocardia]
MPTKTHEDQLQSVVDRLSAAAEADYYNPYKRFAWPDRLDVDGYWMSPELMTVHGTSAARELDEKTLQEISKWESGHFYSLNEVFSVAGWQVVATRRGW